MRHLVGHNLDLSTARAVADRAFASYQQRFAKYQPSLQWTDDTHATASFSALGVTVRGAIELLPDAIAFELDVPIVLRVFTGRAVAAVEREVLLWCDAARQGDG